MNLPLPERGCHHVYVFMFSRSRTSLMTLNWALTDGLLIVAPWPSRAAMTSRASSYFPFRMRRRGEEGEEGAERVNAEGEEYLEGQGESPSYGAFGEREAEGEPVGD